VTHKLALELGFAAGFTIGTKPSDVANYLLEQMIDRKDRGLIDDAKKPASGKK
jgi:beta-lysine 5,6-aminomutase beta subunit